MKRYTYRVLFRGRAIGARGSTAPIKATVESNYKLDSYGVEAHVYMRYERITGFRVIKWPSELQRETQ